MIISTNVRLSYANVGKRTYFYVKYKIFVWKDNSNDNSNDEWRYKNIWKYRIIYDSIQTENTWKSIWVQ